MSGSIYRRKYRDPDSGELREVSTWTIRYYRDGQRIEESVESTKKGDAKRLLDLRQGDIVRGAHVTPNVGRLRFDEAVENVVADYRINERKTTAHVERRIKLHLRPYFGNRKMSSISDDDVLAYKDQRKAAGASNAEINRELAILKRGFKLSRLPSRPEISMLVERNIRKGFFERDAFEDVRAHLPDAIKSVVTFSYYTGWRIPSEVLPLQWSQVDQHRRIIRLEPDTTKNRDGRTFPYGMLPELEEVIEGQWQDHRRLEEKGVLCPYIFHRNGKPIAGFRKAWKTACTLAGIPGRIPHDFRRTAVRNLIRAGVPDAVAMKLTGHKTRSVFDRYNIVSESDLTEAVSKLAGTVAGTVEPKGRIAPFPNPRKS